MTSSATSVQYPMMHPCPSAHWWKKSQKKTVWAVVQKQFGGKFFFRQSNHYAKGTVVYSLRQPEKDVEMVATIKKEIVRGFQLVWKETTLEKVTYVRRTNIIASACFLRRCGTSIRSRFFSSGLSGATCWSMMLHNSCSRFSAPPSMFTAHADTNIPAGEAIEYWIPGQFVSVIWTFFNDKRLIVSGILISHSSLKKLLETERSLNIGRSAKKWSQIWVNHRNSNSRGSTLRIWIIRLWIPLMWSFVPAPDSWQSFFNWWRDVDTGNIERSTMTSLSVDFDNNALFHDLQTLQKQRSSLLFKWTELKHRLNTPKIADKFDQNILKSTGNLLLCRRLWSDRVKTKVPNKSPLNRSSIW